MENYIPLFTADGQELRLDVSLVTDLFVYDCIVSIVAGGVLFKMNYPSPDNANQAYMEISSIINKKD
jgi:hypothetical protein